MRPYAIKALIDSLETARIYAGAEFEKLCNNNQHIDACVLQSIRDSIAQNIQLLQSYATCKNKESDNERHLKDNESELFELMETIELLKNVIEVAKIVGISDEEIKDILKRDMTNKESE